NTIMKSLPYELSKDRNPKSLEDLKGFYHVLHIIEDRERDEIDVIAWNEANNSTWRLIFDSAYKPALEESVKIRITSGKIAKITPAEKKDSFRATLYLETPAIQPEMVKPW
ncbi:MAG: hypothetical protein ACXACP_14060, partial [Candidatus Hodarchaeales archaeon]